MYDQYIRVYSHYAQKYGSNTCVLLQVGSFFELYDYINPATNELHTPIVKATDVLGITLKLKKGDAPGGRDGYFAGFPEDSIEKYSTILRNAGWRGVICVQEKVKGKIQKERRVDRIISAADPDAAKGAGDSVWLGGLWLEAASFTESGAATPPSFGAVAIDLTTGACVLYEGRAQGRRDLWFADDLLHFFQVHPPREMIVWWRGDAIDQPTEEFLRRTIGVPTTQLLVWPAAKAGSGIEKAIVREDELRGAFQPKSLLPLRDVLQLSGRPLAEKGLVAVVQHVRESYASAVQQFHAPTLWNPHNAMMLANHALTQLNMITANESDSVLSLFMKTQTGMGRRAMRERILYPICDPVVLESRYKEIEWWQQAGAEKQEELTVALRHIQDLPRLHRRIVGASTNGSDVLALDQSYQSALRLASLVDGSPLEMSPTLVESFEAYRDAFYAAFDVEKAKAEKDMFCLTEAAGPNTAAIEAELAATNQKIQEIFSKLVAVTEEAAATAREKGSLRLEQKDTGLFILGTKAAIQRVSARLKSLNLEKENLEFRDIKPGKETKSFKTLEVPSITSFHLKAQRHREELATVSREELGPVCTRLTDEFVEVWSALEDWISALDVTGTLAAVATARGFSRPELVVKEEGALEVEGLRHPLIEAQQTRVEYVRHSVSLGAESGDAGTNGWLVYGMNASGKSSLMKAVGIAVLLAQAGSFVPAVRLRISPFRALFTRILNTDNLWAGLSSFAVEMTELREILRRADKRSLVLGDEVCSGTESVSATALVAATLKAFQARGVRYIFATHLHGLQSLPEIASLPGLRIWHLRVRYDAAVDRLIYERTLHPGAGSSLYGLEVAKAMALPLEILEDAHTIRRQLMGVERATDAPASDWNAAITRRACETCGDPIVRDLEVHHIRPRAEAGGADRFHDGAAVNAIQNLAVVCQRCHDAHHAGRIAIGPVQQTSDGPIREVRTIDLARYAHTPAVPGLTEEQLETVQTYLRSHPSILPSRVLYDLGEQGIRLTPQRLRTIRANLI